MCGRFTLTLDGRQLQAFFPQFKVPEVIQPRYNIAPSQPVAAVPNDGSQAVTFFLWGLIPRWAKKPQGFINARAETLAQKPAFRAAYRRRRCLILADGFYEWPKKKAVKPKIPWRFTLRDGRPFAFAGLWEVWLSPDGSEVPTCTIITVPANEVVAEVHDRMPAILRPEDYEVWLSPGEMPPEELQPLLRPYPAEEMRGYPVSPRVNNPKVDDPACIAPYQPPQSALL